MFGAQRVRLIVRLIVRRSARVGSHRKLMAVSLPPVSPSKRQLLSIENKHIKGSLARSESSGELALKYKRLSANAMPLTRGSPLAAGYDLCSAYDYVIPAAGKEMVKTDIAVAIPEGCYGRVAPRSGLAWKSFIDVGAGVIDRDYRGNLAVILFNLGDTPFEVRRGDRVAQLICERIADTYLEETDDLSRTERGEHGFGSTGVESK